ncbi:hypothetical protein DPMN_079890 [Dreissena polymorpha]|uniref:Uncharacterized protein n=1 Tax=Dreissena polymorpha TaxID=45954 RepID=A0A9D3YTZ8_DREPO|nr:hypothetical protein DPMN_079890 [Dreissena polymorpha]
MEPLPAHIGLFRLSRFDNGNKGPVDCSNYIWQLTFPKKFLLDKQNSWSLWKSKNINIFLFN